MTVDRPPFPSFASFYEEITGHEPFPWQSRLADHLAAGGEWFEEIGVPTGTGKTSCLDVAVWQLGLDGYRDPSDRVAPTRIWWVVNRRLLVDATTQHAEALAERLCDAVGTDTAIGRVADGLARRSPSGRPLEVIRLRGGAASGRPTDPAQPAVLLSTVPMFGSRLLFRGYGVSRSMRPIDAAMAGTDSLVLLDEAHLSAHLAKLVSDLDRCDQPERSLLPPGRQTPTIVSLTATGSAPDERRLVLEADDLTHHLIAKRVHASKAIRLVEAKTEAKVAKVMADATVELIGGAPSPPTCVVFANRPTRAREVREAIGDRLADAEIVLLTGQLRERDAAPIRDHLTAPATGLTSGSRIERRERPLVVIATQTLEVGADLDFDHLVTEACGRRSLVQRLGRLNRLGELDDATGTYVHTPPTGRGAEKSWGLYGQEPQQVYDALVAAAVDDVVHLPPGRADEILGPPDDDPDSAPEVLPAILWEWAKTSRPPIGEAPVEPYFSGFADRRPVLTVCWRQVLPGHETSGPQAVWPTVTDHETIDVPLQDFRSAFDETARVAVLSEDQDSIRWTRVPDVPPHAIVLLACSDGRYGPGGWDPVRREPVADVSLLGGGLVLDPAVLATWLGLVRLGLLSPTPGEEPPLAGTAAHSTVIDLLTTVRELVERVDLGEPVGGSDLAALLRSADLALEQLSATITAEDRPVTDPTMLRASEIDGFRTALAALRRPSLTRPSSGRPRIELPRTRQKLLDVTDDLSARSAPSPEARELDRHGDAVGHLARTVAAHLGLDTSLTDDVAFAALLHDIGKADGRFQRWLGGSSDQLLAKSSSPVGSWRAARVAAGWPAGGRHEALSARLAARWFAQRPEEAQRHDVDLVLHLVGAHHGYGRPLLEGVDDDSSSEVTATIAGHEVTAPANLAATDATQPSRFGQLTEQYGHWGLALLEAVLRRADHAVSRSLMDEGPPDPTVALETTTAPQEDLA